MSSLPDAKRPDTFEGLIRLDEGQVRSHVDQVVRQSVEETLNGLLEAEAEQLCGAARYERSPDRLDTRAGHYSRALHTKGRIGVNSIITIVIEREDRVLRHTAAAMD